MAQSFNSRGNRVAVIGAGIIGASVALQLQRNGFRTALFDGQPPGSGASFGNAGLVSVDSGIPVALPGLLRQIPGWILSRQGPLSIDARDLLRATPWLMRWVRQSRADRVKSCSDAMLSLHRPGLDCYRNLLGSGLFDHLIRTTGQLHVWESAEVSDSERFENQLRRAQGIEATALTAEQVRERVPGLSPAVERGLWFGQHAHTLNPQALVQALVDLQQQAGGEHVSSDVQQIAPSAQGGFDLAGGCGPRHADAVVICTGIRGNGLLAPLGVRIPLQAERGYHLHLRDAQHAVELPVVNRSRGIVLTPMSDGLRVAGLVEIADWQRPANPRSGHMLASGLRATLEKPLPTNGTALWVGSRPSTPDNLPVIDEVERLPGLFIACGHSHFGLTGAGMTGQLIVNRLLGQAPSIDDRPFRLARFD